MVGEHTCKNAQLDTGHRQCTAAFVCRHILPSIRVEVDIPLVVIQERIKETFHVDISYTKAWRIKRAW